MDTLFVYLAYGAGTDVPVQLKYSVFTLLRHVPGARDRIVLYTDAPQKYSGWPVRIQSLAEVVTSYGRDTGYHFILKPLVLQDALRRFGSDVLFLDADTYVKDGFESDIFWKLKSGAILNEFEKNNPFPELADLRIRLPHGREYAYDAQLSHMYNSGVIGLNRDAEPVLADSVAIIEALLERQIGRHTIEQFALSEMLRIRGVKIHECDHYLFHYHRQSVKRYVTMKIRKLLPADWDDFDIRGRLSLNALEKRLFDTQHSLEKRWGSRSATAQSKTI